MLQSSQYRFTCPSVQLYYRSSVVVYSMRECCWSEPGQFGVSYILVLRRRAHYYES